MTASLANGQAKNGGRLFWQQNPILLPWKPKHRWLSFTGRSPDRIKEKLPGTIVVLMGDHITAFPDETMRNCRCDYAITGGDYDFLLANIVDHITKGENLEPGIWYRQNGDTVNTGQFRLDHDLNELPMVDRELTEWRLYGEPLYKREPFTYTMVGRDCPWAKCTFCSWTTLFPKFRTRTPESLLDEIGMLIDTYGVREIFDDTGSFPSGGWPRTFLQRNDSARIQQENQDLD